MANRLKMAKIQSIQTLRAQGWSQRRIARALDVDRETVARYVRAAEDPQNQPNPPTGSEGPRDPPVGGQNQPNLPLGSTGPVSQCEPFRELIRGALERGLSAQRIAAHYGTVILSTRPYTPRHKGKVERGVDYVQDNGLKGRTFDSLAAQNHFLTEWEAATADTRIHGTTRQQVGKVFAEVERPALLPLPAARFPFFQEAERIVNRDGHVEVAKAYYSAPPEYVGRRVWVRWDGHVVRTFDRQLQQIAIHAQHEPGRFATNPQHIAPQKRSGIERGTAWWLRKAHAIGPEVGRWAETVLQQRGRQRARPAA